MFYLDPKLSAGGRLKFPFSRNHSGLEKVALKILLWSLHNGYRYFCQKSVLGSSPLIVNCSELLFCKNRKKLVFIPFFIAFCLIRWRVKKTASLTPKKDEKNWEKKYCWAGLPWPGHIDINNSRKDIKIRNTGTETTEPTI